MTHGSPWWPSTPLPATWLDTRLQAHHAVQLLAAFAGEFLEPRDDDGHRSLCWVDEERHLATGSAERADMPLMVTFDPEAFVLGARHGGGESAIDLPGRTLAEARSWLTGEVATVLGVAPDLAPPEYSIPDHPVASGAVFDPDPAAASALAIWFASAASVLEPFAQGPQAGPLRCWPHHFDLATLLTHHPPTADRGALTIGVGVSPGDEGSTEPYGYVTPYPYPWDADRPGLPAGGYWHAEGGLGAVLPASSWLGPEGPHHVRHFFEDAVDAAGAMLTPP